MAYDNKGKAEQHDEGENHYTIDTREGSNGKGKGPECFGLNPWPGKMESCNEPGNGDDQHPKVM